MQKSGLSFEALRSRTKRVSRRTIALECQQFGKPIAGHQLSQAMLADCKVEMEADRALILQTARRRDDGEDVTMDASICKYFATAVCGRVADKVVQIFGGQGWVKNVASGAATVMSGRSASMKAPAKFIN